MDRTVVAMGRYAIGGGNAKVGIGNSNGTPANVVVVYDSSSEINVTIVAASSDTYESSVLVTTKPAG